MGDAYISSHGPERDKGNKEDYYNNFRTFITQNGNMLELVGFLSKEYFNYMRKNKLSAEHSALCDTIKSQDINKNVIDWFKEQGTEKIFLTEINVRPTIFLIFVSLFNKITTPSAVWQSFSRIIKS